MTGYVLDAMEAEAAGEVLPAPCRLVLFRGSHALSMTSGGELPGGRNFSPVFGRHELHRRRRSSFFELSFRF